MAFLLKPGCAPEKVKPSNGDKFSLEELQQYVGGYIEPIRIIGDTMYVNEDGLHMGLPHNENATFLVRAFTNTLVNEKGILGNVIICKKGEFA